GLQVAGVASVAGDLAGAQVSGVVNVAEGVDFQLATVNVADRVEGVQVGVVNVAREADVAIGLINLVGNGRRTVEAWGSDVAPIHVGVKLGARRTYSLLTASSTDEQYAFGAGLGVHLPAERFYVDVDLANYAVFDHGIDQDDDENVQI